MAMVMIIARLFGKKTRSGRENIRIDIKCMGMDFSKNINFIDCRRSFTADIFLVCGT